MTTIRIKISHKEAIRLYNSMVKRYPDREDPVIPGAEELDAALGSGRRSVGIDWDLLNDNQQELLEEADKDPIILVAEKEADPPVFFIGEC